MSEIPNTNPFAEDAFENRAQFAEQLEAIANTYVENNSCVVNLYAKWGDGKTWFLERWKKRLEPNACVIYFDAFKHDLHEEPFISLISVFLSVIDKNENDSFGQKVTALKDAAKKALHHVMFNSLEVLSQGIITADNMDEINNEYISNVTGKVFDAELAIYKKRETDFEAFKRALADVANTVKAKKGFPIVFMVDELDRCRPTYALEVLEKIKHFFDVPNMFFVLSMNKEQMLNSIKHIYGSKDDANIYLNKFCNIEISMPKEKVISNGTEDLHYGKYFVYLSNKYRVCTSTNTIPFFRRLNLSLREMERIFFNISVASKMLIGTPRANHEYLADLICFIATVKEIKPELYDDIILGRPLNNDCVEMTGTCHPENDFAQHIDFLFNNANKNINDDTKKKYNDYYRTHLMLKDPRTIVDKIAELMSFRKNQGE